jgi:hypothetical protein
MARPVQRLAEIAEDQWGLVTRQQAEGADVPSPTLARLTKDGLLERIDHGVYRVRGAVPADHLELRVAWLRLDPARPAWERLSDPAVALVSHASAAALYGVGDLRADVHEFTLPARRQTRRKDIRLHRGNVPEGDRLVLYGLPATRAGRMIADLLDDHVDPVAVAQIVDQVLQHVYDYPAVVEKHLRPYAQRFGLRDGDGLGALDHLLRLAESRDREVLVAEAQARPR